MTSRLFGLAAIAALALAAPLQAQAGGATTAHKLSISLHAVAQTTNGHGDNVPDKTTADANDVFKACVGTKPAKDEGVYLFLNCTDLTDNVIAAIDTNPLFDTAVQVGSVDFDLGHMVTTTSNGVRKSATVPVTISISCDGATTTATLNGIMTMNFSALGAADSCPLNAKVNVTGTGHDPGPGDFIVNQGSAISAANRSGAIASFPLF